MVYTADSLTTYHFNKFINENKEKFFSAKKRAPHRPPIEKALAEEFAEFFTVIINQNGLIISVLNHTDSGAVQKWLDPSSINATKIAMAYHKTEAHQSHENDYAYNSDVYGESEATYHCGQRSILRVCILLYGETHNSQCVNALVAEYENKYNLKSICGVEMKKVIEEAPTLSSYDVPNCYVGNIFYDEKEGIVEGQHNYERTHKTSTSSRNPNQLGDHERETHQRCQCQ